MINVDKYRRKFLLSVSKLLAFSGLLYLDNSYSQTHPKPPQSPGGGINLEDPSKILIKRDDYEIWLSKIKSAADKLAKESGTVIQPEVFSEFDKKATQTLEDKGYTVPMPPMNLQVY